MEKDATTLIKHNAGAEIVLASKGNWGHAAYHLVTSIAAPALLSLPFAMDGLGWYAGLINIVLGAVVTFYSYILMSKVLEQKELEGRRHIRYRELAEDVLGKWTAILVISPMQFAVCLGSVIGSIILGGESLQFIYYIYQPTGAIQLWEFIVMFAAVMLVLSQLPSFHSLRHLNLLSLCMCFGYSICVVGGSIHAGMRLPPRDYSVAGSTKTKVFGVFNGLVIIATTYGNAIIPEIQSTLTPPIGGKMAKALSVCYAVVIATFIPVAVSGYWAFGNQSSGNIFFNLAPSGGPSLIPTWLLFLANMFVIIQLLAVALIYSQTTFEVLEAQFSSMKAGTFSARNLIPRIIVRSLYVAVAALISSMLPFFGDINAIIGAFGFTPLDFVFPQIFYLVVFRPSFKTLSFWINTAIIVVYSVVGAAGAVTAVRQLSIDASNYKLFANL